MLGSIVLKTLALFSLKNTRMNYMRYIVLPSKGDRLDLEEKTLGKNKPFPFYNHANMNSHVFGCESADPESPFAHCWLPVFPFQQPVF